MIQFELRYGDEWWYLVDVVDKNDIEYDIYECYMYEGNEQRQLLLDTHPLYHDEEIREMVEDKIHQYYYEEQRKM